MSKPKPPKIFGSLVSEIVNTGLCMYCGTCIASCPVNVLFHSDQEKPMIKGICVLCELCYYSCPRIELPVSDIEEKIFGRTRSEEEELNGIIKGSYTARSTDQEILKACQDGGATTTLLSYSLQAGIVDYVVVTASDEEKPWKPKPLVTNDPKELLDAAGSKYSPGGSISGIADAITGHPDAKIAYTGMPCQIEGIHRLSSASKGNRKLGGHVGLTLGLFCMDSYHYTPLMDELVGKKGNIDLNAITKIDIKNNLFKVFTDGQEAFETPVSELDPYLVSGCSKCQDFAAELSDISIGAVGSPQGWCTILTRSEKGESLFKDACEKGLLEYKPLDKVKPGIKLVTILSRKKKKREAPYLIRKVMKKD